MFTHERFADRVASGASTSTVLTYAGNTARSLFVEESKLREQRGCSEERLVLDQLAGLAPERVREVVLADPWMGSLPSVDTRA